jgi:hypothetical protein
MRIRTHGRFECARWQLPKSGFCPIEAEWPHFLKEIEGSTLLVINLFDLTSFTLTQIHISLSHSR